MAHRAAIYAVRVRPKRKKADDEYRLLGDIDDEGTSLAQAIGKIGDGLTEETDEGSTRIRCFDITKTRAEVFMMLTHGESGTVADIFDKEYQPTYHQNLEDTYEVKCGALFQLPPAQRLGWLGVHINAGRGVKGLLVRGIDEAFRLEYQDLVLEINPCVSASALKNAAQANRIEKVKLVKLVRPNDPARAISDKWVRGNTIGRLELDITGLGRANENEPQGRRGRQIREWLRPDLVLRYFRQGQWDAAFREMVEAIGFDFDQVKFEVRLPDGAVRTYNIEKPEAGHAMTEDLNDLTLRDGEPTTDSLRSNLRAAIAHAQEEQ